MSWGDFTVPKGYRYHPSDEELLSGLEEKNHCKDSQITTIIPEIDVLKYEPRQLPELAFTRAENLGRKFFFLFFFWIIKEETWDSQRKWYFFAPRDYKYRNSSRSNRTTEEGFWKITGKDRTIKAPGSKVVIGKKRTLTFHKRGVPKAQRTGWVMHEYYLIQEHCDSPKQIGEFVVCCLKYKSDDSVHDKDAPFYNRGSSSSSMASNVENQAQGNWVSQEQVDVVRTPNRNDYEAETGGSCSMATDVENQTEENWVSQELGYVVPIPNGNEAETVGGMNTEEEEEEEEEYRALKELGDALQVPVGNLQEFKGTEQNDQLLDDSEILDSLFYPPAPPQLDQLHQSPMNTTNVYKEIRVSEELVNLVPIPNGNEAETVGGMITVEEEYQALKELENALQVPVGNLQEFKGTEQNDHSTSVEDQPDRNNSSDMVEELLDDPENLDLLFHPPASPMTTTNVHNECRKRAYPFEHYHPTLPKKNNVTTSDDDRQVSNSTHNSENQAANVIPEGHSYPGENLGSDSYSFLPMDYDYTQPSINGGPRDFSNYNNFIELDDLPSYCEGNDSSLAEFSDTIIDGGRRVTSDGNTLVGHGSENDYFALGFGESLHCS